MKGKEGRKRGIKEERNGGKGKEGEEGRKEGGRKKT